MNKEEKMKCKITNIGEGASEIIYDVTKEQFLLLENIFFKLNNDIRDSYSPTIIINEIED